MHIKTSSINAWGHLLKNQNQNHKNSFEPQQAQCKIVSMFTEAIHGRESVTQTKLNDLHLTSISTETSLPLRNEIMQGNSMLVQNL